MDNMSIYRQVANTPNEARKQIGAGRLKGFTDINPMWRIQKLTELFGVVGYGWKIDIVDQRLEVGANDEVKAFAMVNLFIKVDGEWSDPIQGVGGASFVSSEKGGLYTDDECFKKAVTDAIGSACKLLGMSSDIYYANDRTKYTAPAAPKPNARMCTGLQQEVLYNLTTESQRDALVKQRNKPIEEFTFAEMESIINKLVERQNYGA